MAKLPKLQIPQSLQRSQEPEESPNPPPPEQLARLRWHCHRGMLELDLILLRFFDQHYLQLPPTLQQQFQQLLEHPDPDLFAWLMGHEITPEPTLQPIIEKIRHAGVPHSN